jgi:hypothetical protein
MISFRGCHGVAASGAGADNANLVSVDEVKLFDVVNNTSDITDSLRGIFEEVRFSSAFALVGSVKAYCSETRVCKSFFAYRLAVCSLTPPPGWTTTRAGDLEEELDV